MDIKDYVDTVLIVHVCAPFSLLQCNCINVCRPGNVNFALFFSGMGRVQPLISQLLYAALDQAEQSLSTVPAGVGCAALWQLVLPSELFIAHLIVL